MHGLGQIGSWQNYAKNPSHQFRYLESIWIYILYGTFDGCVLRWRSWMKFPLVQDSTCNVLKILICLLQPTCPWAQWFFGRAKEHLAQLVTKQSLFLDPRNTTNLNAVYTSKSQAPMEFMPLPRKSLRVPLIPMGHSVLPKPEFTSSRSLHTCDKRNRRKSWGI